VWAAFQDWIFDVINWFYEFVGDWGLAIIIVTIIFRLIITPLVVKQTKSNYAMQKLNPKMQEIRALYADDPQKQQQETQKLYSEAKFNPISGCLPIILQMPIFIALFQVLRSLTERVDPGTVLTFYGILPDLSLSPQQAFNTGGLLYCIPYYITVALFAVSILVPMLLNGQARDKKTLIMSFVMVMFMAWIGVSSPAGVLLFWVASSIIGILTQQILMRKYKKEDEVKEAAEVKPVKVNVARKEKKARPTKKR
jgi:YidC/Oxa1 family membrane protein insertase